METGRGWRRATVAALAVLVAVVAGGCQVTLAVGVDARADGSGHVTVTATLDKDAATQVGQLSLDDLRQAGWSIDGPRPATGGGEVVRAAKPFANPAGLARVMDELTGGTGPFRDFRLTRNRSLLTTRTSFTGTVDLSPGLAGFADDALRSSLGGAGVGLDPAAVKQVTGVDLDRLLAFTVGVRLPGSLTTSNAPAPAGNGATWTPAMGEKVTLVAASRQYNRGTIALLVVAGAAALALVALLGVRLVRRRRAS